MSHNHKALVRSIIVILLLGLGAPGFSQRSRGRRTLNNEIKKVSNLVSQTYRTIHEDPELGKKEFKTQALIESELRKLGYYIGN